MSAYTYPVPEIGTIGVRPNGRTVTVIGNTAGVSVNWDQDAGSDWFAYWDFHRMFTWEGK